MKTAYFVHTDGTPVVALDLGEGKPGAAWYRANPAYREIDHDEWQQIHDAQLREAYPDSDDTSDN